MREILYPPPEITEPISGNQQLLDNIMAWGAQQRAEGRAEGHGMGIETCMSALNSIQRQNVAVAAEQQYTEIEV